MYSHLNIYIFALHLLYFVIDREVKHCSNFRLNVHYDGKVLE